MKPLRTFPAALVSALGALVATAGCSGEAATRAGQVDDLADASDADAPASDTATPPLCVPDALRCAGAGTERCAIDGSRWLSHDDCAPTGRCAAGVCLDRPCDPGRGCEGQSLVACAADGGHVTGAADCAALGGVCVASACHARVCTPEAVRCAATRELGVCSASGAAEARVPCPSGTACVALGAGAACRPAPCEPGSRWCEEGEARICGGDGATSYAEACPALTRCEAGACVASEDCYTPRFGIGPANPVIAQTVVTLTPYLGAYEAAVTWSVKAPDGAAVAVQPAFDARGATFAADLVGRYTITLELTPGPSFPRTICGPGEATLEVLAGSPLHVELTWATPSDPDSTDEGPGSGADLDLHVVMLERATRDTNGDGAVDGLFDRQADCWSRNQGTPVSSPGAGPTPAALDRDDSDGGGPENANVALPSVVGPYDVYVEGANDYGFGPSVATVRVFVHGALAFEASHEVMDWQIWPAARIDWAAGQVTPRGICAESGAWCGEGEACADGSACEPGLWPCDLQSCRAY